MIQMKRMRALGISLDNGQSIHLGGDGKDYSFYPRHR
jgi:hypothetical protein